MSDTPMVDVKALAELARLEISEAEVATLQKEIPEILKFVEQIQNVAGDTKATSPELRNVLRADKDPHETGMYTKRLMDAAPKSEKDRIVVKQVVTRKQK